MVTGFNVLLSYDKIDMLVVLQINSYLVEFMWSKYGSLSRQKFNVTIVGYDSE